MAPNATATINHLTDMLNSNNAITQWVNALEASLLPALSPQPSWYAEISGVLQSSQLHSQQWVASLGPNIQSEVPQTYINYYDMFSNVVPPLTSLVGQIGTNTPPNIPNAAQVRELQEYVGALLAKAEAQLATVQGLQQGTLAFRTLMAGDHGSLASALLAALAQETQAAAAIQQVQLQIQALQEEIATLSQDATSADLSSGKALGGLVVGIVVAGGEIALGDSAAGVIGFVNSLHQGSVETRQVTADQQQLAALLQQLANDQQQLGILQGIIVTLEKLLERNDAALDTFSGMGDSWAFTVYGLQYLLVVLAQPQIDVSSIPDLNDLSASLSAWQQIESFATDVQDAVCQQQPVVSLSVQA
jgi:hypothetical protein